MTYISLSRSGRFQSTSPKPGHHFTPIYKPLPSLRQEAPHAHQAVAYDDEVLVPDLGSNKIQKLKWVTESEGKGKWEDVGSIEGFEEGDGPRHVVVQPNGRYTLFPSCSDLHREGRKGGKGRLKADLFLLPRNSVVHPQRALLDSDRPHPPSTRYTKSHLTVLNPHAGRSTTPTQLINC